jgi:hypothetical protein
MMCPSKIWAAKRPGRHSSPIRLWAWLCAQRKRGTAKPVIGFLWAAFRYVLTTPRKLPTNDLAINLRNAPNPGPGNPAL